MAFKPFSQCFLRTLSVLLLAALLLTGQNARPAYAAGYTVNSLSDSTTAGDGFCTLREAIASANNVGNGDCGTNSSANDTITFSVSGTVVLGATLPSIVSGQGTLTINGGGNITISGNNSVRVMQVDSGANLTLQNLTITNGLSIAGGGIFNNGGTLTVTGSTFFANNASSSGGSIYNDGALTVSNSTFSGNSAISSHGGSIYNFGALTVSNSTFSGNIANVSGGGIYNTGTLTVTGGTFSNNSATYGGAIYLEQNAVATLSGLWLNGNSASYDGGAIYNSAGTLNIANTTFSTNSTPTNVSGVGYGGAIANLGTMTLVNSRLNTNQGRFGGAVFVGGSLTSASATIDHVTFSQNTAGQSGGGLYTNVDTTVVTVTDSVFNLNTANGVGGGMARFNARLTILRSSFTRNTGALGGGGLYVSAGPNGTEGGYVEIHDATLSTNTATNGQGGGLYNAALTNLQGVTIKDNSSGIFTFRLSGSKVTRMNDTVLQNPNGLNCDGDGTLPASAGGNFSTDNSCGLTGQGDQQGIGLDPKLGALMQDPFGITYYHMPQTGSPLINAAVPPCSPRDQRGALRPDACDIGAVEYGGLVPVLYLPVVVR